MYRAKCFPLIQTSSVNRASTSLIQYYTPTSQQCSIETVINLKKVSFIIITFHQYPVVPILVQSIMLPGMSTVELQLGRPQQRTILAPNCLQFILFVSKSIILSLDN